MVGSRSQSEFFSFMGLVQWNQVCTGRVHTGNFMGQSPSSEADSHSVTQKRLIPCFEPIMHEPFGSSPHPRYFLKKHFNNILLHISHLGIREFFSVSYRHNS
jgi:hypothetical protein